VSSRRGLPTDRRMRHDRHFVEELANHSVTGVGFLLPVSQIEANPEQPRTDLGDLEPLTASIKSRGVLEPLLVRRIEADKRYQLIAGERRFQAAIRAGLTEVPCIEVAATDEEALELALIENLQRRDLSPFEEAEGYRTLVEKYHYTHDEVSQAVGRARTTISEALRLLVIPPAIRDLCRHADITAKSVLLLIARAASIAEMEQLVQEIVDGNLDREGARVSSRRLRSGEESALPSANGPSSGEGAEAGDPGAPAFKPVQIRFRPSPEAPIHLSVSIRKPGITRNEIILTLEDLLARLKRGELDDRLGPKD
jgi:ParB family chromosome partitioning protein